MLINPLSRVPLLCFFVAVQVETFLLTSHFREVLEQPLVRCLDLLGEFVLFEYLASKIIGVVIWVWAVWLLKDLKYLDEPTAKALLTGRTHRFSCHFM